MAEDRTIRKSRRLAQKEKGRAKARDKREARASIGDALGVQSQAKATNLAEANALARAEAAAADLERKTPGRHGKKHRTPKVSRSSRIMRAKVAAEFDSEVDDQDDYDNDSMPALTSDDERYDGGGHADGPVYEEKADDEAANGLTPDAAPGVGGVEVNKETGEVRTPGPAAEPTPSDEEFVRDDDSDISYEPTDEERSDDDDMSEDTDYKRRLAAASHVEGSLM